jgi:hypothetical protein
MAGLAKAVPQRHMNFNRELNTTDSFISTFHAEIITFILHSGHNAKMNRNSSWIHEPLDCFIMKHLGSTEACIPDVLTTCVFYVQTVSKLNMFLFRTGLLKLARKIHFNKQ